VAEKLSRATPRGRDARRFAAGVADGPALVGAGRRGGSPRQAAGSEVRCCVCARRWRLLLEDLLGWMHSCSTAVTVCTSSSDRRPAQRGPAARWFFFAQWWCRPCALVFLRTVVVPAVRIRFFFTWRLTAIRERRCCSLLLIQFLVRRRPRGALAEVFAGQMSSKSSAPVIARVCSNTEP
jgi:hypothetical protein